MRLMFGETQGRRTDQGRVRVVDRDVKFGSQDEGEHGQGLP